MLCNWVMKVVRISHEGAGWLVDVDGGEPCRYQLLADAILGVGRRLVEEEPSGQFPAIHWVFADDFMKEAAIVAAAQRRHVAEEARLAGVAKETVLNLARNGLCNGDIATVLDLSAAKVSKLTSPLP